MRPFIGIALRVVLPLIGLIGLASFAEESLELHVNPFKRPTPEARATRPESGTISEPSAAPPALVLEATVLTSRAPLARINGTILQLGDTIEGYRLKSVRSGQVTLNKAGETLVLKLEQRTSPGQVEHE